MVKRTAGDINKTHPEGDVQLVFVGEENTNGSLLLHRVGHDGRGAFSLLECLRLLLLPLSVAVLSAPGKLAHIAPEKTDDIRVR